jgi:hypothetical protein
MRIEPQKMIKNIDVTCFKHIGSGLLAEGSSQFYMAGTGDSYAKLIPFFENQIEMTQEFGSATREIFFKEPIQFREPLKVPALKLNNQDIQLKYIKMMKIKCVHSQEHFEFSFQGSQINVTCTVECLSEALELCQKRKNDPAGRRIFITGKNVKIESLSLGDWLGE